jgi:hypothetical protein
VRFKYSDNIAYIINRNKTNGLVGKPLYGFGPTIKPASANNQSVEYSGWSPSGRRCGHFRPLTAYTVTRHILLEVTLMAKIQDCVVASSAQDVEVPSQAAVNGQSPFERAFMVKKGLHGSKPVVVDIPYLTNSYLRCSAPGFGFRGRCNLHSLK